MRSPRRSIKLLSLIFGLTLVAAACGGDNSGSTTTTTAAPGNGTTTTGTGGTAAMTLTIDINPKAVWDDGTPITEKDFECTFNATLNTPGSLSTVGYDQIDSVKAGTSDQQVVVSFKTKYAPYKNLFDPILEASKFKDCNDVSADMQDSIGFSGTEWKIDSWSKDQEVLVPNDKFWDTTRTPKAAKVVLVPKADTDTEINSLKSGESDFIFPQAYDGITAALNDPNIKSTPGYGTNYEGIYFQQGQECTPGDTQSCAFKDANFRKAFSESVDRDGIFSKIYAPIFPGAALLQCGLWVPTIGKWCDNTQFKDSYNPTDAAKVLTDAGWTKNGDGFWADKSGNVPTIHWMVNAGNTRRESTQAYLIPLMAKAGFKVQADNCDAACVFQTRLPALQYDLAMYINTAAPDPTVTSIMSCDQVPTAANGNKGQNSVGWCDKDASDLMTKSDAELDETARIDEIHQIGAALVKDDVMLPLFQFPNVAAWRTDKLTGPIDAEAANYRAFGNNLYQWQPTSGTQIVIGAEQWPDCINPITDCANSSWEYWMAHVPVLPAVWDTTADGNYVPSDLVTGEPKVDTGG